jgi:NAD+ kinase
MKVVVVGLDKKIFEEKLPEDFKIDRKKPEIVFSFGGDGTVLYSEQQYPGVPKVFVRHSRLCEKCDVHGSYKKIFDSLREGRYEIVEEMKLGGVVRKEVIVGLNEINVCNKVPIRAVRLQLTVNGRVVEKEIIGDGIVVSTPFGSTAYFKSITRTHFSRGIGIAFNNPVKPTKPMIVKDDSKIIIKILRGSALLCADNNKKMVQLKEGDTVKITKSKLKARLVKFKK